MLFSAKPLIAHVSILGLVSVAVVGATPARANQGIAAVTTVTDVTRVGLSSGQLAKVAYTVAHEATGTIPAPEFANGASLPGAHISRQDHPGVLDGLWADAGSSTAWIAPLNRWQLDTRSSFVENIFVRGWRHRDAQALAAGDRIEVAMASESGSFLAPWNAPRGEPGGRLEWESASHVQQVEATYGEDSGELEVVQLSAHVVARGGDVDARSEAALTDWLEFDLPRSYPIGVSYIGMLGTEFPFTRYIDSVEWEIEPTLGTMRMRAQVRGWIPEARDESLGGRVGAGRWHLPIRGLIAFHPNSGGLPDGGAPLAPRAQLELPAGGTAFVTDEKETLEQIAVGAGGVVRAGVGLPTRVVNEASSESEDPSQPEGDGEEIGAEISADAEADAAAAVDHRLADPVTLTADGGRFEFTLDADLRGNGILGLRGIRHTEFDTTYALTAAAPAVIVDGELIRLDRSRLTDLRVVPLRVTPFEIGIRAGSLPSPIRAGGALLTEGFSVDAVYDLGDGLHARVTFQAPTLLRFGLPDPTHGGIRAKVSVWRIDGAPTNARTVTVMELPTGGPVIMGSDVHTKEFQTPLSVFQSGAYRFSKPLQLGGGTIATIVRAPVPLAGLVGPDPDRELGDGPIGVVWVTPPNAPLRIDLPASGYEVEVSVVGEPEAPPAGPPRLGESCRDPGVIDDGLPDAPQGLDVRAAWFDLDAANLYATIQIADLPEAALPETTFEYELAWAGAHRTSIARAVLDPSGEWSFGDHPQGFGGGLEGEVKPGPDGLVRITIPRSLLWAQDGELLRDVSAHSWFSTPLGRVQVDSAAAGYAPGYGLGSDYVVRPCFAVSLTKRSAISGQYTDETLFEARLTGSDGDPVEGAELVFELTGEESERDFTATTGPDGLAAVTPVLTEKPGSYVLTVRFDGDAGAATTSTAFVVEKEDSDVALTVEGQGNNKTLRAQLSDLDTSSAGIADRTIDFYSDGELIGSDVTGGDGVASVPVPAAHRGNNRTYEAVFEGDDFYLGASDDKPGKSGNGGGSRGQGAEASYAGKMLLM